MQDREFALAKALLTVLSGRSRGSNATEATNKASISTAAGAQSTRSSRRHRFDDKSGPPPPRGSLTSDKLSYLDWRLKRINYVRQKSEGTSMCWIDGRDTIGRTSFDLARSAGTKQEQDEAIVPLPAPQSVPMPSNRMAAIYAEEKAAGIKALEHVYAGDSVLASMPHLAKRDSSSGSEVSGSSDQHTSDAPAMLHATADKHVGGVYFANTRRSILTRAGSHFGKKKTKQASALPSKTECAAQDTSESRPISRNTRSISRIWNR